MCLKGMRGKIVQQKAVLFNDKVVVRTEWMSMRSMS